MSLLLLFSAAPAGSAPPSRLPASIIYGGTGTTSIGTAAALRRGISGRLVGNPIPAPQPVPKPPPRIVTGHSSVVPVAGVPASRRSYVQPVVLSATHYPSQPAGLVIGLAPAYLRALPTSIVSVPLAVHAVPPSRGVLSFIIGAASRQRLWAHPRSSTGSRLAPVRRAVPPPAVVVARLPEVPSGRPQGMVGIPARLYAAPSARPAVCRIIMTAGARWRRRVGQSHFIPVWAPAGSSTPAGLRAPVVVILADATLVSLQEYWSAGA